VILSDRDIRSAMQRLENPLIIDPPPAPRAFQPASVEMTLGSEVWIPGEPCKRTLATGIDLELAPGEFGLATTVETVHIPTDLVAQVNGKSTWARRGLIVHTTAGFIDPGFRGQITLELANLGPQPILVPQGAPICQLVFFQMTSPAQRPYGTEGLASHYQDQSGVTSAHV
jgi:dCTP deaminase